MLCPTNFLSDGNPPQLMAISAGLTRTWILGGILNPSMRVPMQVVVMVPNGGTQWMDNPTLWS